METKEVTNTKDQSSITDMVIRIEELAAILGLSKKTIYNRLSANDDMPPVRKFGKKLIWLRKDVESWLEDLPTAA